MMRPTKRPDDPSRYRIKAIEAIPGTYSPYVGRWGVIDDSKLNPWVERTLPSEAAAHLWITLELFQARLEMAINDPEAIRRAIAALKGEGNES